MGVLPAPRVPMPLPAVTAPRTRSAARLLLALVVGGLLVWLAGDWAGQRALASERQRGGEQLRLVAEALASTVDRYRVVPALLAEDSQLRAALEAAPGSPARAHANRRLEAINARVGSATLTLIDAAGLGVAASNWREPGNNLGYDYSFRPYFRQARDEGRGHFYGIGVTTGRPGYYLTEALRDAGGAFLGAVALKLELLPLEAGWAAPDELVLVSDADGVVFLASRPEFRYRSLQALSEATREAIQARRQYPGEALSPLLAQGDPDGHLRLLDPALPGQWLRQSQALPGEAWTLHRFSSTRPVLAASRAARTAALAAWLALVFLLLWLEQRWRLSRLRQRSRRELETLVSQHAEALRTAEDGVVEAARRAALGKGENLEHLPQGVSVVDAQLRLVAWNRRYVEFFRFPPELMRVGQPIEDLLRHNARRGLLGPGDPEEAIQRRLEHLRSGRPHMHERERPDGTVLEIRGNPLPGGGFVTSFADITSYKQAARELRSLAESLERRVAERTEALAAAKTEAERANRAKTRFVAAAVHDLLQPLNAARMFVSALRGAPVDPARMQALAGHADAALGAQDAILGSLLDIARIESGAVPVQRQSFAPAPLFEALHREFAVLAAAKGLRLRSVIPHRPLDCDPMLLRRLLQNLLSNAVRHTRQGRVLFGGRRTPDGLRIEVWDTGPGIPADKREEIFEEFRRLDGDGPEAERGAGLGLAIVDRIRRRLGLRLELKSWPGRGSLFAVTVPWGAPLALVPAPTEPGTVVDDEAPLAGRSIWCIDDDPRQREGLSALLQSWGAEPRTLAGLEPGAPPPGPCPELLLLDYHLGNRRGPELWAQLAEYWPRMPATILITAEHDPSVAEQARERGWDLLHKPVKAGALRALISQRLLARPR